MEYRRGWNLQVRRIPGKGTNDSRCRQASFLLSRACPESETEQVGIPYAKTRSAFGPGGETSDYLRLR